jgi:TRAP-type uncharacterized transport system substrate-binding protein
MIVEANGAVRFKFLTPGSNWVKIGGALAAEVVNYYSNWPAGSRAEVHTGHPSRTALESPEIVDAGGYDIGMATPSWLLRVCNEGRGTLGIGERPTKLRLLAALPHHDLVAFAVRKSLGFKTLKEVIDQKFPLRFSTAPIHNDHPLGWFLDVLFKEYGIEIEDFEKWGGAVIYNDRQQNVMEAVPKNNVDRLTGLKNGTIDAVFDEAIMVQNWRAICESTEMQFLTIEPEILESLYRKYHIPTRILPAGYLPGITSDIESIEFGGWTIFCREDLPDDIAYLVLESLEKQKPNIENMFTPATGLSTEIDFSKTHQVDGVPLHPGAERFYRERGYL